jgi:hypothetical protein
MPEAFVLFSFIRAIIDALGSKSGLTKEIVWVLLLCQNISERADKGK